MSRIAVIFYSMSGNVALLARAIARGAEEGGADVRLRRVRDLAAADPPGESAKAAQAELADVPFANEDDLRWCDGVAFGSPTRFGNMTTQLKAFIDQLGGLWLKGELVGKLGSCFTSSSTQHGGQESTLITMMIALFHLGFIVMGLPYAEQQQMQMEYIQGGSPYGVSSVSGMDSKRRPTKNDLEMAESLGRRLAETAAKLRA